MRAFSRIRATSLLCYEAGTLDAALPAQVQGRRGEAHRQCGGAGQSVRAAGGIAE